MKKWIALAASLTVAAATADDNQDVIRKIDEMQRQIQAQQEMINQLRSQLGNQQQVTTEIVRQEVETAVSQGLAQSSGSAITLGKGIDGLTLKNDLRLRYEYVGADLETGGDQRLKSRFRHRLRLGGVWTNASENWEIGLGLEAGSSDGTSANDSWNKGSVWESGDIFLDYAYARHIFGETGMSLTLGQQKNPWKHSFLTFDGDLRPTGATLAYASDTMFATVGAYNLRGDSKVTGSADQSLANMYGGQLGLTYKCEDTHALFALGFFHYDAETTEYAGLGATEDYNYQIGTAYGEVGSKVGEVGLKATAEFAMNFGADNDVNQGAAKGNAPAALADYEPEDNDMAWMIGLEAKFHKVKAKYAYGHIEGDSIPWFVSDSDFGVGALGSGRSVNVQGHSLGLSYAVSKNLSLGATAMFTELIEPDSGKDNDGMLYQFDAVYKF